MLHYFNFAEFMPIRVNNMVSLSNVRAVFHLQHEWSAVLRGID